jgi:hypothetical protein
MSIVLDKYLSKKMDNIEIKYLDNGLTFIKEYFEDENIKYEKELEYEVLHGKSTYYFNNIIKNSNNDIGEMYKLL